MPTARGTDLRPGHDQCEIFRIEADGLAKVRERLIEKTPGIPRQAAVAIGDCKAGIKADGLGEAGNGLLVLFFPKKDQGSKMMTPGIGRS